MYLSLHLIRVAIETFNLADYIRSVYVTGCSNNNLQFWNQNRGPLVAEFSNIFNPAHAYVSEREKTQTDILGLHISIDDVC